MTSPLDPFIPVPDVSERFEIRIAAPSALVMRVAYEFDMQSIWLIRSIILARKFILGGTPEPRRSIGIVEETRSLGWGTLIEEADRLLVCGAACQPWLGDVKFTPILADQFAEYRMPDQVKIAWSLETVEVELNTTRLVHEVRAAATDSDARRKFLRYWRWARFGIIAIRLLLLPAIRRNAEREWRSRSGIT